MFLVVLCLFVVIHRIASLGCISESGSQVPWFIAVKKPNSYSYVYMDANSNSALNNASHDLKTINGSIMKTLNQLWTDKSTGALMFNDETPDGKSNTSKAHMKGIIGVDSKGSSGFYLLHSTPGFPNATTGPLEFFDNKTKFGQSFFCVSLDSNGLNTVGSALKEDYPNIYQNTLPHAIQTTAPELYDASIGVKITTSSASYRKLNVVNSNDTFYIFSKNKQWNKHFWAELVAPTLGSDMNVETWIRETGLMPYCKADGYKYNVNIVNDLTMGGTSWTETQDHSKWGVTTNSSWACVGDINLMTSQSNRGGGSICIKRSSVAKAFAATIKTSTIKGCSSKYFDNLETDLIDLEDLEEFN